MHITFLNQIDFDCPLTRLAQFINRTPIVLGERNKAYVQFDNWSTSIALPAPSSLSAPSLEIEISCRLPNLQLSSIEQVCNSSLHPLSTVELLYIEHRHIQLVWKKYVIENTLWLQFLLPFTAVKYLYLSKEFAPGIMATLQEPVGGRITEVLPSLQNVNIIVEGREQVGLFQENIGQLVTARQLSGHPIQVAISIRNQVVWESASPPVTVL
jgi:hypothetical protein